jgi:ribosomal protein S12 methylthiotransferase accessory factor
MLELKSCPKKHVLGQDKALPPETTVERVKDLLGPERHGILAETRRIDTGRLGIPVFLSLTSEFARGHMPTRKQMGKGSSPVQAEASALMELAERFSFFSFFADESNFQKASWSEAEELWPGRLIPAARMLQSVDESMSEARARRILDLVEWRFAPALNLSSGREEMVPLDWFRLLNEFNGSSAGNTFEESLLQGACEIVERHVSALAAMREPVLPTIVPESNDPVLAGLLEAFAVNGVTVLLKDMSMGFPVPTVGAVAWDPETFPDKSEIVFTAGTASSPVKAAVRALTEVAQLAGDFETGSNYEASGLPKYRNLEEILWLRQGPEVGLATLPCIESDDFLHEISSLASGLDRLGYHLYSVDISNPLLQIPCNYNFVPGFQFRERDRGQSLGLFTGRMLAENIAPAEAAAKLDLLESEYPQSHFVPFFKGLTALRTGKSLEAEEFFCQSETLAHNPDDRAMAAFYRAYSLTGGERWREALPLLDRAVELAPEVKEYLNLRGVARFKLDEFEAAAGDFKSALDLDSGSATDLANLGLCYRKMNQAREAIHCLGQALTLDPTLDFAREQLESILSGNDLK